MATIKEEVKKMLDEEKVNLKKEIDLAAKL